MRKADILQIGASVRADLLRAYQSQDRDSAHALAQRVVFEIGEMLSDIHGREIAAGSLYNVADAVTCHLPLKDFRSFERPADVPVPAAKLEDTTPKEKLLWVWRKCCSVLADRFFLGFVLGMIARGAR